jgi:hypothetical protein
VRAILISLLAAVTGCSATGAREPPQERPLLLVLPPGGFLLPSGPRTEALEMARRRGFAARQIDYVLGDPLSAWHEVRGEALRARRNGRAVYAYGESAGGVLASLLAKKGIANAAVSNGAPSNMTTWTAANSWHLLRNHGLGTRRALSPVFGPTRRPILAQDTPEVPVTFRMNTRWAKRDPMVRFSGHLGGHVSGEDYRAILGQAMAFLAAHR